MTENRPNRWIDIAALAGLAALALLFFWKIALTNRILTGLDVFAYFYPYRDFSSQALRSGQIPLWNPYLFMGAPLLANSQTAVLYPLHWPLLWLSAPKQLAWSIVLHIGLASAGTYLFARRSLRVGPAAALVSAAIFGLGGFLSAQVEHLNQLNASAWLPWLLLCLDGAVSPGSRRWPGILGGGAIVGLMLLAGHTQAAYIVLAGAGLYALFRGLAGGEPRRWTRALGAVAALAVMVALGLALAVGQLAPTLELSGLSVRSGGLPYREAASFSLKPGLVFKAFLPPFLWEPPFSEYVAYIGLVGLALAALGGWTAIKRRRPLGLVALLLAAVGVLLALGAYNPLYYLLYRVVPGFDLFRAPARWLLLYAFGAALLAGLGLESLNMLRSRRIARWGLLLLLVIELFLAGRKLAYNQPTAPAAYDSLRTAPAHLLADASGQPFRFLSLSDILFDPGDLGDLQALFSPFLPEKAVYDLIVSTKMKEVLAYNLPLRYRLGSVDGYDGGLLPIEDYVHFERLFLPADEIWPDGRLRQQLPQIPPARLLSLLNVKYVITDKVQDVWIDDVFYDLEHTLPLGSVTLDDLPDFQTTHLGLVSYLTGTLDLEQGTPVATVTLHRAGATPLTQTLRAGEDTAEGLYDEGLAAHRQARVGHRWGENDQGADYVSILEWGEKVRPTAITVQSLLPGECFVLRGLTLIDGEAETTRTLTVDPTFRLVHSGDVKIYENLAVQPRAFVVHRARIAPDPDEALAIMQQPDFDPAAEVLLAEGDPMQSERSHSPAHLVEYAPERVRLDVNLNAPGYLVLTDTYYPGWTATVDGQPVPILRADLYFRAVPVPAGAHQIAFEYQPTLIRAALLANLIAWLIWALLMIATCSRGVWRSRTSMKKI